MQRFRNKMNTTYATLALGLGYPELKAIAHATLHKEHCQKALVAALICQDWKPTSDELWPQWKCPHQVKNLYLCKSPGLLGHTGPLWVFYELSGGGWPWLQWDSYGRCARDLCDIVNTLVPPCNH